jgi:hypothetical protein
MYWREQVLLWFTRAAQFWLVQTLLLYLCACIVAGKPVGPKEYVGFTYHVMQWQPGRTPFNAYPSQKSRETADTPHMNFLEDH